MTAALAATGHAGPNGAGWVTIALLVSAVAAAVLLKRRNRRTR